MTVEVVNVTGPAIKVEPTPVPQGYDPEAFWLVGCGNMAGAMVEGWRAANADLAKVTAIRPSGTPVTGLMTVRSIGEAGLSPGLALLGFKPQLLDQVAPELAPFLGEQTVVLSMLAGVELASLRARFRRAAGIVRIMPNLPVAVRRGVIAVYGENLADGQRSRIANLLAPLGYVAWCGSEAELGAIGSVGGAGPAYVARFIEALAKAGEARGLDAGLALTIARETVLGTGWLAAATGEPMDELVRRVKSPKGTTEAGLSILEPILPALIEGTIAAAGRRAAELAADARAIDSAPARP